MNNGHWYPVSHPIADTTYLHLYKTRRMSKTRSEIGKLAVNKGKTWEQEVVRLFRAVGIELKRNGHLQRRRGGSFEYPDLENEDFAIECGRGKQVGTRRKLEQARMSCKSGRLAIAVTKDDRKEAIVTLRLVDFLKLMDLTRLVRKYDWKDTT